MIDLPPELRFALRCNDINRRAGRRSIGITGRQRSLPAIGRGRPVAQAEGNGSRR